MKKRHLASAVGILFAAASAALVVGSRDDDASAAVPRSHGIAASSDPAVVERGRYLVTGIAHCSACHGDPSRREDFAKGADVPLSGGYALQAGPLGTFHVPNITPDPEVGIGAMSDDEIVSLLRYGQTRHGRATLPFMPFSAMSDEDLRAVISYLRSQPPVHHAVAPHALSLIGKAVVRYVAKAEAPAEPPPASVPAARTAEYGAYLARSLGNCVGCHTQRNKLTAAYTGPEFAGGFVMEEPAGTFVTPNLTPIAGGVIAAWTEQEFIDRFHKTGRLRPGSPMPWEELARLSDDDLGAIYRHLRSVAPAETPR